MGLSIVKYSANVEYFIFLYQAIFKAMLIGVVSSELYTTLHINI